MQFLIISAAGINHPEVFLLQIEVSLHQAQHPPQQHRINGAAIGSGEVAAGEHISAGGAIGTPNDSDRPELQRFINRRNRVLTHQKGRTGLNHIEI
jgi:hypothetical protein